jgi:P27 family predicted phage terminase small subunit
MKPGRKPVPTALRRMQGNPGKRGYNHDEPEPPEGLPSCPQHLNAAAREEWDRLANVLHEMGVVTLVDRAALAAYCQCYGRWVEAEEKLRATPILLKTATGYVQQSPWLSIANKQLELMGRYMAELGLTPASRSRVAAFAEAAKPQAQMPTIIEFVTVYTDKDGKRVETPMNLRDDAALGPSEDVDDTTMRYVWHDRAQ